MQERSEAKSRLGEPDVRSCISIYIYIDKTDKTVKMYMCVVSTMCM